MFEAMCLGKAAVVLPQTDAEIVLAKFVHEQGGVLGIGFEYLRHQCEIEIGSAAYRAAALVDGHGAERVAEIVGSLL
jgi:hypothetical protein